MFLKNDVHEAGLGGFQWRDELLLEGVKTSRQVRREANLRFLGAYAGIFLLVLAPLAAHQQWAAMLPVAVGLAGFFAISRFTAQFNEGAAPYTALFALPVLGYAAYSSSGVWGVVLAFTAFVVVALGVRVEGRGEFGVIASSLSLLHPLLTPISTIIAITIAYRTGYVNRNGGWLPKTRKDWEPAHLPLGYGKPALKALQNSGGKFAEARRTEYGSIAERRTALLLQEDLPFGSYFVHDIPLPGADSANIDHLIVTTRGVFVLDTKEYSGKVVRQGEKIIHHNSIGKTTNLEKITRQMEWALREVRSLIPGKTVKGMVLIHTAAVNPSPIGNKKNGVAYLPVNDFKKILHQFPEIYSPTEVEEIAERLAPVAPGLQQHL